MSVWFFAEKRLPSASSLSFLWTMKYAFPLSSEKLLYDGPPLLLARTLATSNSCLPPAAFSQSCSAFCAETERPAAPTAKTRIPLRIRKRSCSLRVIVRGFKKIDPYVAFYCRRVKCNKKPEPSGSGFLLFVCLSAWFAGLNGLRRHRSRRLDPVRRDADAGGSCSLRLPRRHRLQAAGLHRQLVQPELAPRPHD